MPQNFLSCDREQVFLMPLSLREWLPANHLAWFVLSSVEAMDLAPFYASYRSDGHGRPAHDPGMMVALLLYAYCKGQRSSWVIEHECVEDIAYRVIAASEVPDHTTIARFRQRHETALAGLFGEVLTLCAQEGLVKVGVVAIDGTKVHANAGREATRDYEQIAKEILEQAAEVDRQEDEQFGDARGDELPAELSTEQGRRGWLREAKRRLDAKRAEEAYRERGVDKTGRGLGAPPKPFQAPATPQGKINVTDPDSQLVHGMRGWIQGYNAQAAVNESQIVLAAGVSTASPDFGQLDPMVGAVEAELEAAGVTDTPA